MVPEGYCMKQKSQGKVCGRLVKRIKVKLVGLKTIGACSTMARGIAGLYKVN